MLKELFEGSFYVTFDKKDGVLVNLQERTFYAGDFSLLDPRACQGCQYVCSDELNDREQLRVHSDNQAYSLSVNDVFSYIKDDVGEICDYMIDTCSATALVEMTCSNSDYVKDKRQKSRRQLYNTLALFHANPVVKHHIEQKEVRFAVFSWRETFPVTSNMDSVEDSMRGMMLLPDAVYSPDNESNFDYGFKLKEIRYPDVFVC